MASYLRNGTNIMPNKYQKAKNALQKQKDIYIKR